MTKNERFMKLQRVFLYLMYKANQINPQALEVICQAQKEVLNETDL